MTGTCLIKISDVLTLCRGNFKILSGALYVFHSVSYRQVKNAGTVQPSVLMSTVIIGN